MSPNGFLVLLCLSQVASKGLAAPEALCHAQKAGAERPQPPGPRWTQLEGDSQFSCVVESVLGAKGSNGLSNVLNLMATSEVGSTVQDVRLTLRLFHPPDADQAWAQFPEAVRAFFATVGLELPPKILEAVKSKRRFSARSAEGILSFEKVRPAGRIDEWAVHLVAKPAGK